MWLLMGCDRFRNSAWATFWSFKQQEIFYKHGLSGRIIYSSMFYTILAARAGAQNSPLDLTIGLILWLSVLYLWTAAGFQLNEMCDWFVV